jgi:phage terminase small subunit
MIQMTSTELATIEEDRSLGPAMRELTTDKQRLFVRHLVATGCKPIDAAEAAGYSNKTRQHLSTTAYELTHDPRVQKAIHEESLKVLRATGPMALKVLCDIAADKNAADRDRIKAATELLNRGGFHSVNESLIKVDVTDQTEAEKDRRINELLAKLGLDQATKQTMLSALGGKPAIDAEFKVVDPETPIAPPRAPRGRPIKNPEDVEKRALERAAYKRSPEQSAAHKEKVNAERRERSKRILANARADRGEPAPPPEEAADGLDEEIRRLIMG